MKRVRWNVIWYICSPIAFFVAAVWYWQIFCLPNNQAWNESLTRQARLSSEVRQWKVKYQHLLRQANYLAVENNALNRTFDKLSKVSLQQTILDAEFPSESTE
jgi:hypothetical protein